MLLAIFNYFHAVSVQHCVFRSTNAEELEQLQSASDSSNADKHAIFNAILWTCFVFRVVNTLILIFCQGFEHLRVLSRFIPK
jgi:hypothetical protein